MNKIKLLIVRIVFTFGKIFPLEDTIVFESFLGRRLDENIYYLMESVSEEKLIYIYSDINDSHCKIINEEFNVKLVKKNSLKYFFTMATTKTIVTNSRVHIGLLIKRPNQTVIQLWHGIPWKHLVHDQVNFNFTNKSKEVYLNEFDEEVKKWDYLWVPSQEAKLKLQSAFKFNKNFIEKMYPSDVKLLNHKNECEIHTDKYEKVVLYMPTFREYGTDIKAGNYEYFENFDFEEFAVNNPNILFIVRGHYLTSSKERKTCNIINMSNHHSLNDLYTLADILITDYSSAIYHFSLLNKPIISICFDFESYSNMRGLYDNAIDNMNITQIFSQEDLNNINIKSLKTSTSNQTYFDEKYDDILNDIIRKH